jgi:hypothetical protein
MSSRSGNSRNGSTACWPATPARARASSGAPAGAKYQAFKEAPYKDDFDEWLARIVCYAFSLPPTAFTPQVNRATAQTAQEAALEEGLAPLIGWVKRLIDGVIQNRMGHVDLEFAWSDVRPNDPKDQAALLGSYVKDGIYAINEVRDILGLSPVEGGNEPMFLTAQGPVRLHDAVALKAGKGPSAGDVAAARSRRTAPATKLVDPLLEAATDQAD